MNTNLVNSTRVFQALENVEIRKNILHVSSIVERLEEMAELNSDERLAHQMCQIRQQLLAAAK